MDITRNDPPREFQVGAEPKITMRDCGQVSLDADEQLTFVTEADAEYDVARKSWGFYATPSTNGRLASFKLRTALVVNSFGKLYVMLVEAGKENDFARYLEKDAQRVIAWLDDDAAVDRLCRLFETGEESSLGHA